MIATEISLGEELQLLVGLTHEIVVDNFIVFGFQDLKVRKSSELVDVRESVLIKINLSQVFIILQLVSQIVDALFVQVQNAECIC